MAAVDLHPDVVEAIRDLADTKLGRRYNRFAKKRYGVRGPILAGKTVAGEFGGRSTRSGRGVVSSAGARGPAQFIPSTRQAYMQRYGVDPWAGDKQAIKAMMLHHLNTGVEGYNPGMPTYRDYILGQRLNKADRRALKRSDLNGNFTLEGPRRTKVKLDKRVVPGQSFEAEREAARRELLLSGDFDLEKLLAYKASVNSLRDVPARTVPGDLKVKRTQGPDVKVQGRGRSRVAPNTPGGIYEVFYDPLGKYWDSGSVQKGAIGGHGGHVHVSADEEYVVKLGRLAQSMGLHVGEQDAFGGRPTSGHTQGSFHYRGMAIDVSGDARKLRKFARIVMREARRGRGR
jgi:hypothetical protein